MRLGIIGTGRIARRFVPECVAVSGIDVTVVYNPHSGKAQHFINDIWDIQASEQPVGISDIAGLWNRADAIYIASPHETHYGYIMEALKHGKHVICEKPMTLNGSQAEEAFEYARTHDAVLIEGIKTAYCPGYRKILDIINNGDIGEVRHMEACFTKLEKEDSRELNDTLYGGSFTELGSYVMLPVLDILGKDSRDISFDSINSDKGIDLFTKSDFRYKDSMATLLCGLGVKSEGRLIISGTRGYIKADAPWWKTSHIEVHFEDESKTIFYDEPFEGDGLRYEIQALLELIQSNKSERAGKIKYAEYRSVAMAVIMEKFLSGRDV